MKLTLPAFFYNDEVREKDKAGEDPPYSECDVRRVVLYNVTSISQVVDTDEDKTIYANVYCGGSSYATPFKQKEVERMVDVAMNNGFYDGFKEYADKRKEMENNG